MAMIKVPLDKRMPASKAGKMRIVLGGVLFVNIMVMTLFYLGFQQVSGNEVPDAPALIITTSQYWVINALSGMSGAILMDYKNPLISGFSGLVTGLLMSAAALLYFGWRENIGSFEIIIPLFIAIVPGILLYDFLKSKKKPAQ